tara:strand:+ start:542 stop:847 length:306 start_codon:yes stop_codon:yes gene_type:complete
MMRIWTLVPALQHPICEEAFALLRSIAPQDRVWLHWGMPQLAYPIFRDLASTIGRLLKLQEEVLWDNSTAGAPRPGRPNHQQIGRASPSPKHGGLGDANQY